MKFIAKFRSRSLGIELTKNLLIQQTGMQFAYGAREVLLDYMNLDYSHIFPGILQHGEGPWEFMASAMFPSREGFFGRLPIWVHSNLNKEDARTSGIRRVESIGSPWLYLPKSVGRENIQKGDVLIFPRHSTPLVVSNHQKELIRKQIDFWLRLCETREITICLYWTDFLNPNWHRVADEEGIGLACSGLSESNPPWSLMRSRLEFLTNLRDLIESHSRVLIEEYTSALFYSLSCNKPTGLFVSNHQEQSKTTYARIAWLEKNLPKIIDHFAYDSYMNEFAESFLGIESKRNSEDLKELLSPIPNMINGPQFFGEFE